MCLSLEAGDKINVWGVRAGSAPPCPHAGAHPSENACSGWEQHCATVPRCPSPASPVESIPSLRAHGTRGPGGPLDRVLWGLQVPLVPVSFTGASCQDRGMGCHVSSGLVPPLLASFPSPWLPARSRELL